jgi:tetratricopeptide (TPR) repeat protein
MRMLVERALVVFLLGQMALAASNAASTTVVTESAAAPTPLERGYRDSYNLDFGGAQNEFRAWERSHPADPMGPVSEAAGDLFAELDRLGVLETQFFEKDSSYLSRPKLAPDPKVHARFEAALARAQNEAEKALAQSPKDANALFAMTLVYGLRADYTALILGRNLDSLGYTKQANAWAQKLLAVAPETYDAYVATGISKYIIGSLAAPLRWLLRMGGYSGDKKTGIRELELAADRGHYLAPFARLLLAVAYLRQNDAPRARALLAGLHDEFPANPLFPKEIARIDGRK